MACFGGSAVAERWLDHASNFFRTICPRRSNGNVQMTSALSAFQVANKPLYLVGLFDAGVTVYSQQVRALNLAFELIENGRIPSFYKNSTNLKIAIIGAGFSGLTIAKGLFNKWACADITIFERRDTLLPLQHGSDARWLHPRIYEWPAEGSDTNAAMLPVLNWVAARASDVVVQVLKEWASEALPDSTRLYCNSKHLQIHEVTKQEGLQIEWVGERRDAKTGNQLDQGGAPAGCAEMFDLVILTTGFGLERDEVLSYWRNDTIGQPNLDKPKKSFIISGQGDGAIIDLLRLRVSQYRQDRILNELFAGQDDLIAHLRSLQARYSGPYSKGLYKALENLESGPFGSAFLDANNRMRDRLRRDTDAVLHIKLRTFSDLFDSINTRISFQNRLLVFILYRCGGFVPSSADEKSIRKQNTIRSKDVVRRHGTLRDEQLKEMLSIDLYAAIQKIRGTAQPDPFSQSDTPKWPGGYFGYPGRSEITDLPDHLRADWRKEYVPGSVSLLAAAFCASVAGFFQGIHDNRYRLRITFHRTIEFSGQELLQQCCEYFGSPVIKDIPKGTGRTFPAVNATIGLAYTTQKIVLTRSGISLDRLAEAMTFLNLNRASSAMSKEVSFIIALPLIEPRNSFYGRSPVAGVLYADSTQPNFELEETYINDVLSMLACFGQMLANADADYFDRVKNIPLAAISSSTREPDVIPPKVADVFMHPSLAPPTLTKALMINFDHSDFIPAERYEAK